MDDRVNPIVVSASTQEFDGARYWLCGRYFQRKGKRLHRAVWERENGPVPAGCHVHHVNGNVADNRLENLTLLSAAEHGREHGDTAAIHGRRSIRKASEAARVWHSTPAGRKWHAEHYEKHVRKALQITTGMICEQCNSEFQALAAFASQTKFCGANCRAKALRLRRKAA